MKYLFAIGNPGKEYAQTYHNLGLIFADWILSNLPHQVLKNNEKFSIFKIRSPSGEFVVIKSHVFMNTSYSALGPAYSLYKLTPAQVLVLHDELMLPKFDVKIKQGGGNAGHNGLRDIAQHIGSDFARLRIGIGHPQDMGLRLSVHDYVLSKIDDVRNFEHVFAKTAQPLVDKWLQE